MQCGPSMKRPLLLLGFALTACSGGSSSSGSGASSAVAPVTSAAPGSTTATPSSNAPPAPSAPVRTAPANLATGPGVVLDASGTGAFFDLPWPLDARRNANGSVDLTGFPNPKNKKFIKNGIELVTNETHGASPTGAIYFRFDAPVNAPVDDPAASLAPGSPVLLVDIDPASPDRLTRNPVRLALTTKSDSVRPANLLQVLPVPGRGMKANTLHAAIVLRKLGAPGTAFLGQSDALHELLQGNTPKGALGAKLQTAFTPLSRALFDLGIHPDDVAAATVFTTGDPSERLVKQVDAFNRSAPMKPTKALAVRDLYPAFTALKGQWAPPQFQKGVPPYVWGGGHQAVDAQGMPVVQWWDRAEFQVSIPKGKMPAKGFPLYFWVHGTGGEARQVIDSGRRTDAKIPAPLGTGIASYVAPRGWATACAAGPLSPRRIGFLSGDGYAAYDFFNPHGMRDNFAQMILEMTLFRRLLLDLKVDPSLCPGTDASASPDGKIRFDPDTLVVGGQSLGSFLAGMLAGLLPDWKGVILTGAGGSWVEFPFGPLDPIMPSKIIDIFSLPNGEHIDLFHPLVMAFDLALGPADNTHYVEKVQRRPLPGHNVPHSLVIEGHGDIQVPDHLQRALVLSLGADLVGGEVAGIPTTEQIVPALPWGGLKELPYPASNNRNGKTSVVLRYEKDPIREGHFVTFQLDEPKRQIGEFLSAISAGQVPVVK